ncbi:NADPH-dependent oxidoreductase [Micromonospora sp. KC207]|uniref:NADPH-dependent FMN reductase n=1 Tax=Micromonospora sp. KC207 TaxID=2530377 RepID=UPI00104F96C4|nr:NADPH-dependent FMN reductase [Micromonospora sp. KC207]TDC49301.1 NADPH-dependent oxidoreductase [Micromonospora sp. KC207]
MTVVTQFAGPGPLVVGLGGTTRPGSTSERGLRAALRVAESLGARTVCFDGRFLAGLPAYAPEQPDRTAAAVTLVEAVRAADGLIVATPAYHAGISGLVKNALDYLEDLSVDERPYLDGRAVGCVVAALGGQALGSTLDSMRAVIHALRGWPAPVTVCLESGQVSFGLDGACGDPKTAMRLDLLGRQVVGFAAAQCVATAGLARRR